MAEEPKTGLQLEAEAIAPTKRGVLPVTSGTAVASLHDQGLSGIIGAGIVWLLVTYAHAHPPTGAVAPLVYGSAASLGTMIGAKIPGKYRAAIQYTAAMLAGLYGINLGL
jgi:hypothetical protein